MTEEQSARTGVWHWVKAVVSTVSGDSAGGGENGDRPGSSADQLVVACIVVGVILVIAVILISVLVTSRPG